MKKSLRIQFGERVKALRVATGMSQEAFADRCGFARSYMSRIERGGSNASLDAIEVLAYALSVESWQLLAPDSSENNDLELFVPYAAMVRVFTPAWRVPEMVTLVWVIRPLRSALGRFQKLRSMETAKWRRHYPSGNWGIVSAVRWGKLRK